MGFFFIAPAANAEALIGTLHRLITLLRDKGMQSKQRELMTSIACELLAEIESLGITRRQISATIRRIDSASWRPRSKALGARNRRG